MAAHRPNRHGDEGAQQRVALPDPGQEMFGGFHGRDLAAAQHIPQLYGGEAVKLFGHWSSWVSQKRNVPGPGSPGRVKALGLKLTFDLPRRDSP